MAEVYLSFTLYFIGELFLNGISYKLYVGALCSAMVFILIAVMATGVVMWRHRKKRKLVAVRAVAGRTEKGATLPTALCHNSSSIRHHQSAQELHHMCSHTSQPPPPCEGSTQPTCGCHSEPVCRCGNTGCSLCLTGPCCSHSTSAAAVPVTGNTAYESSNEQVVLATNASYTALDRAPALAPPPPPSYYELDKVKSLHEYDYIIAKSKSQQ